MATNRVIRWDSARLARLRRFVPRDLPLLRLLLKRSRVALNAGRQESAVRLARLACWVYPSSPAARSQLIRSLLIDPSRPEQLHRALGLARAAADVQPASGAAVNQLVMTIVAVARTSGVDAITDEIRVLARSPEATAIRSLRAQLSQAVSKGAARQSQWIADAFFQSSPTASSGLLALEIALLVGDYQGAAAISDRMTSEQLGSPEDLAFASSQVDLASGNAQTAVQRLTQLREQREPRYSQQLIRALRDLDRHDEIIAYLDTTAHGLNDTTEAIFRFDALDALGQQTEAAQIITRCAVDSLADLRVFRRLRQTHQRSSGQASDQIVLELVREFEADVRREANDGPLGLDEATKIIALYCEVEAFDEIDRVMEGLGDESIGPTSRRLLARTAYVRRDFATALAHIEKLDREALTWDIEKLHGRILLESHRFREALDARRRYPQLNGDLDEVLYHTLLNLGEYEEAFGYFLRPRDLQRFRSEFGERVEVPISTQPRTEQLVLAQSGPGDEIMLASVYRDILDLAAHTVITCEPRLEAIMKRSFPEIEFVAVDRNSEHRYRADSPLAGHPLRALLTPELIATDRTFDRVIPTRSLPSLKHRVHGTAPIQPYLCPQQQLVDEFTARWGHLPPIGIVWRSERRDALRNIHYLEVDDLEPMLSIEHPFVSLQYDATDEEREGLLRLTNGRAIFIDEIDMRNDFESLAALLRSLRATVGIGTTTVELSGAVGTPTIMVQPTTFGTWRSMDGYGTDYWHKTVRVTSIIDPWRRPELVEETRQRLLELLTQASR